MLNMVAFHIRIKSLKTTPLVVILYIKTFYEKILNILLISIRIKASLNCVLGFINLLNFKENQRI